MNTTWVHRFSPPAASSSTVELPAVEAAPFDDLVGSWNADIPAGAELAMQGQVRVGKTWSKWYDLGSSKGLEFSSPGRQEDAAGFVDIDTLKLREKASAFRLRFTLSGATLRLAAAAASDDAAPALPPFKKGPWVAELKVRPRSQMEEQEKYKQDICSPTALAMVLEYWKISLETLAVAEAVADRATGLFGVWPSNIALAAARGLEGYVARLESLEDLQSEIAQGRPTVVSVTFGPGELAGAPLKKTRGHLLLVTGFTPEGNIIAQDPAAPDRKSVRRIYDRTEFHRAWRVNKRGLAYVITGPFKKNDNRRPRR